MSREEKRNIKNIFWTDEKIFTLTGARRGGSAPFYRTRVTTCKKKKDLKENYPVGRRRSKRSYPHYTMGAAGVSHCGVTPPYFCPKESKTDVAENAYGDDPLYFQQDEARPHTSVTSTTKLRPIFGKNEIPQNPTKSLRLERPQLPHVGARR